jgi:catechol 2,3-dioxygenase-like lactoylglutathione lyase family enzyme
MPRWPKPSRWLLTGLAALGLWTVVGARAASLASGARAQSATPRAGAVVEAVGMTVDDMDRALAFYTKVLPFETVSDERIEDPAQARLNAVNGPRRVVRLRLGEEALELTDYLNAGGRPIPPDSRSHDRWFQHVAIIVSDMDRAYAQLRAHGVDHVSPAPQRLPDWNRNAGGIEAFYFRDPDRHVLEILSFPEGKGAAKWHAPGPQLFRGIDHTAIVVSDTARSLGFYRGLLGLAIAGASENYGIEQERLNNVPGAHLRITALRGTSGPGVEFLEYLTPRDGRPAPADGRADDIVFWETTVGTRALGDLAARLRAAQVLFISPDIIRLPPGAGLLVRDSDGHAVKLVERTS